MPLSSKLDGPIMGHASNITGWITFFIGLYAVGRGIGEFRRPGFWARMVPDFRDSPALQFLTGSGDAGDRGEPLSGQPWNPVDRL